MISRSSNVMINRGASVGFPLVTGISGAPPPRGYCDDLFKKSLGSNYPPMALTVYELYPVQYRAPDLS